MTDPGEAPKPPKILDPIPTESPEETLRRQGRPQIRISPEDAKEILRKLREGGLQR